MVGEGPLLHVLRVALPGVAAAEPDLPDLVGAYFIVTAQGCAFVQERLAGTYGGLRFGGAALDQWTEAFGLRRRSQNPYRRTTFMSASSPWAMAAEACYESKPAWDEMR